MKQLLLFLIVILICVGCNDKLSSSDVDAIQTDAEQLLKDNDYENALKKANEAFNGYVALKDSSGMAKSLFTLARTSALNNNFEKAKSYGEEASTILRKHSDYDLEYKVNNILSWSYFELGHSFLQNQKHYERQLFVVEQLDNEAAKAMVYNNYGYDGTVSGALTLNDAINYTTFANEYYAREEAHNGRWYTLMNLTWQHRLIMDFDTSERFGNLAVKQALKDNDRHAVIEAFTNLGETYLAQNKIENAKPLYLNALEWSKQKLDRDKYVFDVYYSRFLWVLGKKQEAITSLKNAITFLENSEVFYEMLGRSFLVTYLYMSGEKVEAQEQVAIFNDPRANYISQEAKILVNLIEARLLRDKGEIDEATALLNQALDSLKSSQATLLQNMVKNELKNIEE